MYLPGWLYELKPVFYASIGSVGVMSGASQPLGTWSAGLIWLATGCMCYMRFRFRHEHRGQYWHRASRKKRTAGTSTTVMRTSQAR